MTVFTLDYVSVAHALVCEAHALRRSRFFHDSNFLLQASMPFTLRANLRLFNYFPEIIVSSKFGFSDGQTWTSGQGERFAWTLP
jgi:hypothetical protein